MNTEKHSAPSPAIKKDNGKWTFYVYPDGREREAGQYDSEAAAKDARFKALLGWGANGERYESSSSITKQRFLD